MKFYLWGSNMKRFLVSILLFTLFLSPLKTVKPIDTKTVIGGTAVIGIASGVAYWLLSKNVSDCRLKRELEDTPDRQLNKAMALLEKVKRNLLLKDNLSNDDVNEIYFSLHFAWPLVYAAKDLELSKKELQEVSELVKKVFEKVGNEMADSDLQQRLQRVSSDYEKLNDLSWLVSKFIYRTRGDEYQKQLLAYQAEAREERRIQAKERREWNAEARHASTIARIERLEQENYLRHRQLENDLCQLRQWTGRR